MNELNKYRLKQRTSLGYGFEYIYVYANDDFERYLLKHNLKYEVKYNAIYKKIDEIETYKQVIDKIKEYAEELRLFDNESVEFEISSKILELLEEIE